MKEKQIKNVFLHSIYIVYGLIKEGSSHLDTLGSVFDKETDIASRTKQVKRFLKSKYTDCCELLFFPFLTEVTQCHFIFVVYYTYSYEY